MISFLKKLFGIKSVNFAQLIEEGAIIVDVRTPGEYSSGHIQKSINIPLNSLQSNLKKLKNKNTPIITCCASGMRSASAKGILTSNGYTNVYNGGGWMSLQHKLNAE